MDSKQRESNVAGMDSAFDGGRVHPKEERPFCADPAGCNAPQPGTSFPSWMSPVQVRSPAVEPYGAFGWEASPTTVTREPAAEYHKSAGTSCSMLKEYQESALGYYLRYVEQSAPPKTSAAMQRGSLLHLLAEHWPNPVDDHIAIAPDEFVTATGALSKSASKWLADIGDKLPTTAEELESVKRQWAGVLRNPAARSCIESAEAREFVVRWDWEGHQMRCRVDGTTRQFFYDLKTTRDHHPLKTFHKSVREFGYDLQSAVYAAASVAIGMEPHRMAFIVTSNLWPHPCHVVRLPADMIQRATQRALQYLAEIRQRTEWGHWLPDDYGEIVDLFVPAWREW